MKKIFFLIITFFVISFSITGAVNFPAEYGLEQIKVNWTAQISPASHVLIIKFMVDDVLPIFGLMILIIIVYMSVKAYCVRNNEVQYKLKRMKLTSYFQLLIWIITIWILFKLFMCWVGLYLWEWLERYGCLR
jgi:hypothetical protein